MKHTKLLDSAIIYIYQMKKIIFPCVKKYLNYLYKIDRLYMFFTIIMITKTNISKRESKRKFQKNFKTNVFFSYN